MDFNIAAGVEIVSSGVLDISIVGVGNMNRAIILRIFKMKSSNIALLVYADHPLALCGLLAVCLVRL